MKEQISELLQQIAQLYRDKVSVWLEQVTSQVLPPNYLKDKSEEEIYTYLKQHGWKFIETHSDEGIVAMLLKDGSPHATFVFKFSESVKEQLRKN